MTIQPWCTPFMLSARCSLLGQRALMGNISHQYVQYCTYLVGYIVVRIAKRASFFLCANILYNNDADSCLLWGKLIKREFFVACILNKFFIIVDFHGKSFIRLGQSVFREHSRVLGQFRLLDYDQTKEVFMFTSLSFVVLDHSSLAEHLLK